MVYGIHGHDLQNGADAGTFYGPLVSLDPLGGCRGDTRFDSDNTVGYCIRYLLCLATQSVGLEPPKVVAQMDEHGNVDESLAVYHWCSGALLIGV